MTHPEQVVHDVVARLGDNLNPVVRCHSSGVRKNLDVAPDPGGLAGKGPGSFVKEGAGSLPGARQKVTIVPKWVQSSQLKVTIDNYS